jgi:hypothetical protein
MNKKLLMPIAFALILGIGLVSALWNYPYQDNEQITFTLRDGWNMVPNSYDYVEITNQIQNEAVVVWALDPTTKKFLLFAGEGITPSADAEAFAQKLQTDESLKLNYNYGASWVYWNKGTKQFQKTLTSADFDLKKNWQKQSNKDFSGGSEIKSVKLYNGWNFIAISPGMIDSTLNDLFGTCNPEKVAKWINLPDKNEWDVQGWSNEIGSAKITKYSLGDAFLIKVKNDCTLMGGTTQEAINPPQMP